MVHWIALGILCLGLIALSFHSPRLGYGLLSAIAISLAALYYFDPWDDEQGQFDIDRSLIVLDSVDATGAYGDGWNYAGRVINNSASAVTDVQIRVTLHDCESEAAPPEDCVIIGQEVDFVPINIPARQARDFDDHISFTHASLKGYAQWEFEIFGARVAN